MEVRKRFDANEEAGSEPSPDSSRIFGTMVDAGSGCYLRARDLPRLIALWPHARHSALADRHPDPYHHFALAVRRAALARLPSLVTFPTRCRRPKVASRRKPRQAALQRPLDMSRATAPNQRLHRPCALTTRRIFYTRSHL